MRKFLLNLCEPFPIGVPDRPAEGQVGHSTAAFHLDKSCLAEVLEVVRDGGCGDDLVRLKCAASHRFSRSDLLQDGEAARVGESAPNGLELLVGERDVAACHNPIVTDEDQAVRDSQP